jgi:hypothetical protein
LPAPEMTAACAPPGAPPRFPPGRGPAYWTHRSELLLSRAESGALVLPKVILWAFGLNEGDLLTVTREPGETFRCRFQSYGTWLWISAEGMSHPWPFIEKMLRRPMAAVGRGGTLRLPEEAAPLARPGDVLLLVAPELGDGFLVEPAAGRRISSPQLYLEALYVLPVEDGCLIRLPQDVLWVLGLAEGDLLVFTAFLGTADFEPFAQGEPLKGRSLAELRSGGALLLPRPLLQDFRTGWQIRLTVTFDPEPRFRLTYAVA